MKVAIIDCFDSFTYNLYQLVGSLGAEPLTITCDQPLSRILDSYPDRIILSPGPGTPDESGICPAVIRTYAGSVPILGVCLGHQTIIQTFGGNISRMGVPRHGKTSTIIHTGTGLFRGLPNPFPATRYHSLMVSRKDLPADFDTIAIASDDSCVMAVSHREMPIFGVQFHPESIMTPAGAQLIGNFLAEGA
jgi:anthranilate synthase/aminodeoxychorismate synthase-like glutamine amidotransferase